MKFKKIWTFLFFFQKKYFSPVFPPFHPSTPFYTLQKQFYILGFGRITEDLLSRLECVYIAQFGQTRTVDSSYNGFTRSDADPPIANLLGSAVQARSA